MHQYFSYSSDVRLKSSLAPVGVGVVLKCPLLARDALTYIDLFDGHMIREIAAFLEPWKHLYADSTAVSTTVTAAHILSLLTGGGLAIAADRTTLRTLRSPGPARQWFLAELRNVHRPVLIGILGLTLTGLLLVAADFETFVKSWVFWVKMGLVLGLLANGALIYRAESRLNQAADRNEDLPVKFCFQLRLTARLSIALWLLITVMGTVLVSAAS